MVIGIIFICLVVNCFLTNWIYHLTKTVHKIYISSFFLITIFTTLFLTINGFKYYSTSVEEIFFLPQDVLLKPSGFIGQGISIIGSFFMIIGVASYMLRKLSDRL